MKSRFLASLALAGALAAPLSASAFVLGGTVPGKWGPPVMGTGATVTWSLMGTGTSCAAEFAGCTITSFADFMPAGYLTQVSNAFAAWSAVANITFVQVADDGAAFNAATASGDIRLGGHTFDGASGILAWLPLPGRRISIVWSTMPRKNAMVLRPRKWVKRGSQSGARRISSGSTRPIVSNSRSI